MKTDEELAVDRLLKCNLYQILNLVLTVGEMRQAQKAYFRVTGRNGERDRSLLIRSKELESLVDKELAELLNST